MDEIQFLKELASLHQIRHAEVFQGIGDDAALVDLGSKYMIITTDTLVEDNHFSFKWYSLEQIGWKAVESNVSDIAAMGGKPTYMLVAGTIPKDLRNKGPWPMVSLSQAIESRAAKYGISVIGGDMTSSPKNELIITIMLLGEVEKDKVLTMNKVKIGDQIFVTGNLGGSGAALSYLLASSKFKLSKEEQEILIKFQNEPVAQLETGQKLAELQYVTACTDISDGLATDLLKLVKDKQIGFKIFTEKIPAHPVVKKVMSQLKKPFYDSALYGGEDFQLVFTVEPKDVEKVQASLSCFHVGAVTDKQGIELITKKGSEQAGKGYDQFGKNEYGF